MKQTPRILSSIILLAVLVTAFPALGAEATGYRADLLADLENLEGKIVGLAEAIPADKLDWRPASGVRSVSEALMHTAGGNFFYPTLLKITPPAGVDMENLEKISDRDKVVSTLKQSFEHIKSWINNTSDEKLSESINMFGRETTISGALHAALSHNHEHLGQLIAYARSIGVTPPWSQ